MQKPTTQKRKGKIAIARAKYQPNDSPFITNTIYSRYQRHDPALNVQKSEKAKIKPNEKGARLSYN